MNRSQNQILFGMILICILILSFIPQTTGLAKDHSVGAFKSGYVFLHDPTEQLSNQSDIMPIIHSVYLPIVTTSGITRLVSVASDGTQGNDRSEQPSISADGRYVAFSSLASNLVNGDTNNRHDIFIHDRQTRQTSRVAVSADDAYFDYRNPTISADGSHVAYDDANNVYVYNRQTGQTSRVSIASDGTIGNSESWGSSLSGDGRYVAYESLATNLISGDTNNSSDIFVHDRQTGQTSRVSVSSDSTQANGSSGGTSISADGRFIAYHSDASNLVTNDTNDQNDVFIHDRQTGQTRRVSVASNGSQSDGFSLYPSASADGQFIAFWSTASNLVWGDTNQRPDIFVHDMQTGETSLVSIASNGELGNNYPGGGSSISADGRFVAFASGSSNLVSHDTNEVWDIFIHERQTGQTRRVSISVHGTEGNGHAWSPSLAADGRYLAYRSEASNMVLNDNNDAVDIFVYDP